jgi:hypothetical protein
MFLIGIAPKEVPKSDVDVKKTFPETDSSEEKTPQTKSSNATNSSSKVDDEDDPFADDDSFLVEYSQALDQLISSNATNSSNSSNTLDSNSNHKFKLPDVVKKFPSPLATSTAVSKSKTSTVTSSKSKSSTVSPMSSSASTASPLSSNTSTSSSTKTVKTDDFSSVFDDDDSEDFEYLLSQIELPPATAAASKSASHVVKPASHSVKSNVIQPQPRPVINQPNHLNSRVSTNLVR